MEEITITLTREQAERLIRLIENTYNTTRKKQPSWLKTSDMFDDIWDILDGELCELIANEKE